AETVHVVCRHREHTRRAGGDAELAAFARLDVDRDRAAALDRRGRHTGAPSHAGYDPASTASNPARNAVSFAAMCCVRYEGTDSRIPSITASSPMIPVTATYAPVMTIDAPSSLPSEIAMSLAGTRSTWYRSSSGSMNVASFTSTKPPSRTFGPTCAQYLSCMPIADHACDSTGGAWIGPSPTTTLASVLPPRIMPP